MCTDCFYSHCPNTLILCVPKSLMAKANYNLSCYKCSIRNERKEITQLIKAQVTVIDLSVHRSIDQQN
uniref:Uncharacterized protein n=1 Tax=Setaria italica TaxID=4555 RepID=K3XP19_SETIT